MTVPIGVVMLGCAHTSHAWSYARAVVRTPGSTLVGVFDESHELAAPICRDFTVPYHDDVDSLVRSPVVEAAIVCSTTVQHRPLVEQAASHGLHVLCEKPIATEAEDAYAMVAACREERVQLHTAFVSRFLPLVEQARAAVAAGRLGSLIGMVGGNRGRPPLAPTYPPWITTPAQSGGGALIDHSVHVTDAMRHVTGLEVTSVAAEAGELLWSCGVDDVALLSLVFGEAIPASVDPSWSVPAGNPWDYDFYLRLVGTEGSLAINDLSESLQLVSDERLRLAPFGVDLDARMVEAFMSSVREGRLLDPCASGEDGVRALEVALAGYESAASHRTVRL